MRLRLLKIRLLKKDVRRDKVRREHHYHAPSQQIIGQRDQVKADDAPRLAYKSDGSQ